MPSNKKKSDQEFGPEFSKKSSVGIYILLMIFAWSGLAVLTAWLSQSETAAIAVFCIGIAVSGWIGFRLQAKHRVKHPKTAADKSTAMRTTLIAGSISLVTAVLLLLGQGIAAICFLVMSTGVSWIYMSTYGLVNPFAKDRKSAIWLTVVVVILLFIVAASQRGKNRGPHNENLKTSPPVESAR